MKFSPFCLGFASRPPLPCLSLVKICSVRVEKINGKVSFLHSLCYIRKNSLPKENESSRKKKFLSEVFLSSLRTHPFLLSSGWFAFWNVEKNSWQGEHGKKNFRRHLLRRKWRTTWVGGVKVVVFTVMINSCLIQRCLRGVLAMGDKWQTRMLSEFFAAAFPRFLISAKHSPAALFSFSPSLFLPLTKLSPFSPRFFYNQSLGF